MIGCKEVQWHLNVEDHGPARSLPTELLTSVILPLCSCHLDTWPETANREEPCLVDPASTWTGGPGSNDWQEECFSSRLPCVSFEIVSSRVHRDTEHHLSGRR